jgi:hypothetical protein
VTASRPSQAELNRPVLVIIAVPLRFFGLLQATRTLPCRLILRTLRLP